MHEVIWGSRFLTCYAVAQRYRSASILLVGDAADEHSPIGGQCMNLGIHDAITLARTLFAALEGGSAELLDTYAEAQRPVAKGHYCDRYAYEDRDHERASARSPQCDSGCAGSHDT